MITVSLAPDWVGSILRNGVEQNDELNRGTERFLNLKLAGYHCYLQSILRMIEHRYQNLEQITSYRHQPVPTSHQSYHLQLFMATLYGKLLT